MEISPASGLWLILSYQEGRLTGGMLAELTQVPRAHSPARRLVLAASARDVVHIVKTIQN
jgi:hypothetical protein